jgi:hypothetical protein
MKQALIYSLKVWLTSVTVSPIIIVLLTKTLWHRMYRFDSLGNIFGYWGMMIYLASILSIPSLLLLWLSSWQVTRYKATLPFRKWLLSLIGILLTATPFYIVFHSEESVRVEELAIWMSSYSLVIIAGVWLYKLKPVTKTIKIEAA